MSASASSVTGLFVASARATRATPWSPSRRKAIGQTATGTVHAAGGGVYTVLLDDGRTLRASLRGRLKHSGGPVVIGDRVSVGGEPESWTIEAVQPRRSELVRRGRFGRASKVLAANLDRVFAVLALVDPPASPELIDRLLVLNKVDLEGARGAAEGLLALYERLGYRTLLVSAVSGEGLQPLRDMLSLGTSALIGPSGVGKSSILNAIEPGLDLRIGKLSKKTGTGRHTTVSSRLIELECGGLVADTPGFGEVALWGVEPHDIARCYPEFRGPSETCRFRSCTHLHEPGCGVREALSEGRIPESRFLSYQKIRTEAAAASTR